jgi:hypothetical protein
MTSIPEQPAPSGIQDIRIKKTALKLLRFFDTKF